MARIEDIPYLRIWPRLFDYKSKDDDGFEIDVILLFFVNLIIFAFLNRFHAYFQITAIVLGVILVALFYLQFLSLSSRRINKNGGHYLMSLISLTVIGIIVVLVICSFPPNYFKPKDASKIEKVKRLFMPLSLLIALTIVLFVLSPLIILLYALGSDLINQNNPVVEKIDRRISEYTNYCEKIKNASTLMPSLDQVGKYKDAKLAYQLTRDSYVLSFYDDTLSLFLFYGENYQEEKNMLDRYDYLEEPLGGFSVTTFVYRGYSLKIVPDYNYYKNSVTVHSFMMVGFNDERQSISYFYYYNFDLDYISNMADFLGHYFYWY